MADTMARLMISIPAEGKKEIDVVKQKEFFDKPYAELYREIIRLGPDKTREADAREKQCEKVSEGKPAGKAPPALMFCFAFQTVLYQCPLCEKPSKI